MHSFRASRNNKFQNNQRSFGNRDRRTFTRSRSKKNSVKLDPSFFIKKASNVPTAVSEVHGSFSDFKILPQLQSAIRRVGYTQPTPIQNQSIPHLLAGRDILGIANTGTGKTAAFLIPLIDKILRNSNQRILIVAPTRELAQQIEKDLRLLVQNMNISSLACIGGAPIYFQVAGLRRTPHFVIGTPGRLLDLEKRNAIQFSAFSSIVLDEVDRMLDMGFISDVTHIIQRLPAARQSLFFSATLPTKMESLVRSFLRNHVTIQIQTNSAPNHIDQDVVNVNPNNKRSILEKILSDEQVKKTIVFGRTKWGIKKLTRYLSLKGYRVAEIHGNRTQSQRQRALERFRNHEVRILLATDVAARGIDVDDITHVINYDVPETYDDYIHRIGRTGRAGKKGIALTFIER